MTPSELEAEPTTFPGATRRAQPRRATVMELLRRLLLANDTGFAAIQSVMLQLVMVGANLVTGVITARLLGPEGRGIYAASTSWPTLLGMLATAGLVDSILVEVRRRPDLTGSTIMWGAIVSAIGATLLTAIAWVCMPWLLGDRHAEALQIARWSLLMTYGIGVSGVVRFAFAGRGKFLLANISSYLPHVLHAVAICLCAAAGVLTVTTAIGSLAFGVFASQIVLLPFVAREAKGTFRQFRSAGAALWSFGHRAAPADVLALFSDWADRLLLIALLGPRELGLYVVAYGFAQVVTVMTPTNGLLLSAMMRGSPQEAKQLHDISLRFCIATLAISAGVGCLMSDFLVKLFYGPEFLPAVRLFEILVVQAAASRIASVTAQLYLACNRPGLNSAFALVNVVLGAALMVALTPIYGAAGAAFGLLAGTLARLALLWIGLLTHLGFTLPRVWLSPKDLQSARLLFRQ